MSMDFSKYISDLKVWGADAQLAQSLRSSKHKESYTSHLDSMYQLYLKETKSYNSEFHFSQRTYNATEFYLLSPSWDTKAQSEVSDGDWDEISNAMDVVEDTVKRLVGRGKNRKIDYGEMLVDQALKSVQSQMLFTVVHGEHFVNPWDYTTFLLKDNKCLFYMSDNREEIEPLLDKQDRSKLTDDRLTAVFKGQNPKFAGLTVADERQNTARLVASLLKEQTAGPGFALQKQDILRYLEERHGIHGLTVGTLATHYLSPLKQVGLIGSSSTGYFFIRDFEDAQASLRAQLKMLKGVSRSLAALSETASRIWGRNIWDNIPEMDKNTFVIINQMASKAESKV